MKRASVVICAAAVLGLGAGVGEAQAPPAPSSAAPRLSPVQDMPVAELQAFVDGAVRQAMADHHIAGATVAIVQDGQVVFEKGYGFAGLGPYRPVDPNRTLFRIGSISNVFTWILVHRQVEAGHMRLDAPINLYLPEALRIPDEGFSPPIRVRDLMNHTPGFEDRVLGQLFERGWARVRPLNVYLRQERPHRVRAPQTAVSYSNYGAALAGAGVAEVSGRTFESLVESDITGPLGMSHTSFREPHPLRAGMPAPLPPLLAAKLSDGYRWTAEGLRRRPFEYIEQIGPAGAGSSTASDMARLMLTMLGGGSLGEARIYGPATAAAFARALPGPAAGVPGWRHGLMEFPLPGGFTGVGHGGATVSFLSRLVLVPPLRLGVFVSENTDTGGALPDQLAGRIVEHFYAPPPGPPPSGSKELLNVRAAFAGVYLTNRRAYGGLEGFVDRLIGEASVNVTDSGRLAIATFDGVERFAPLGRPGEGRFVADDGVRPLAFHMREGRAERFFDPAGTLAYDRLPLWRRRWVLLALTALTAAASLVTLGDVLARLRRGLRESSSQHRAGVIQSTQAFLWLLAMGLFGAWAAGAGDPAAVLYGWPGPTLILASSSALVASLMAILSPLLLPLVWRGGRRVDSWSGLRKMRFTLFALLFLTYAVLLATWGALEPWSA